MFLCKVGRKPVHRSHLQRSQRVASTRSKNHPGAQHRRQKGEGAAFFQPVNLEFRAAPVRFGEAFRNEEDAAIGGQRLLRVQHPRGAQRQLFLPAFHRLTVGPERNRHARGVRHEGSTISLKRFRVRAGHVGKPPQCVMLNASHRIKAGRRPDRRQQQGERRKAKATCSDNWVHRHLPE